MSDAVATEPLVLYEVDEVGVALISWNRPDRNNAWTPEMEVEYFGLLTAAANDPAVRVIVVTGAGKHFCPGMDTGYLSNASNGSRVSAPEDRQPQSFPTTIPKLIVTAIHGACAGTGFIQACMSDVRFAETNSRITAAFSRRGIMAEHGLSVLLPALVGGANATDILMSGRVLSGEETAAMGLTRRSEPGRAVEDALAYARDIAANCSPQALAVTKEQLLRPLRGPLEAARLEALEVWRTLREHNDFKEGVSSFVEKRPPQFAAVDAQVIGELAGLWNGLQATP
ncbi:MAG: Enoyl-CoA hydratase/carnithine racemase [Microbacteriaceae bacterium]|nr:Enoyl-CoA hydratase/carnithine racemase [Microbacteriaceae bacterium]